jgi:rhodanese-related sulfurtransferase
LVYVIVDILEADELEEGKIDEAIDIPLGQLIRKARNDDILNLRERKFALTTLVDREGILQQMSYRKKDLIL